MNLNELYKRISEIEIEVVALQNEKRLLRREIKVIKEVSVQQERELKNKSNNVKVVVDIRRRLLS